MGNINIELDPKSAPQTVSNFLQYVDAGFYSNTVFHRVIPGFMIQGGGFEAGMTQKPTTTTVRNESANGLQNLRGTIAMARRQDPDSASAQFFINLVDNNNLDGNTNKPGYTVFGKVTQGMAVVDKIAATATHQVNMFADVPVNDITIISATRVK